MSTAAVARDDTISLDETQAIVRGGATGVLANDYGTTLQVVAVDGFAENVGMEVQGVYGVLRISVDGAFSYRTTDAAPRGVPVEDAFTYTVLAADGTTSTAAFVAWVSGINDAPVAVSDAIVVPEAQTARAATLADGLLSNDLEPDVDDELTVVAVQGAVANVGVELRGDFGVMRIDADGVWTFVADPSTDTLGQGETLQQRFTYAISDAAGAQSQAWVDVVVEGRNDAPQAYEDLRTVSEGGVATSTGAGVLANDVDIDASDRLTVVSVDGETASVGAATAGTWGALTLQADGSYVYVADRADALAAGETATDAFAYSVADLSGASSPSRVSFTVLGVNDAPVAANDAAAAIENGAASGSVLANDSDVDASDVLHVFAVEGEAAAVGTAKAGAWGTLTLQADGSYVYVADRADALAEGQTEVDRFTYSVSDSHGGVATAALEITLTGRNDGPVAIDDVASTVEDAAPAIGDLLANDADVDAGDAPSLVSVDGTAVNPVAGVSIAGAHGLLQVAADGRFVYVADQDLAAGQTVTESFDYVIEDIYGAQDTATLTVTATGVNDAPVAGDDAAGTLQLGVVSGAALSNDADVDAGDVLRVAAVEGAAASVGVAIAGEHGSLTLQSSGAYTYRAGAATAGLAEGETAVDVFTYLVADDHGGTDVADLEITVTGTNDAPTARADSISVKEGGFAFSVEGEGLLANDIEIDLSDRLQVVQVEDSAALVGALVAGDFGVLSVDADGGWTYVADSAAANALAAGQLGVETFSYRISDTQGAESEAVITVTVTGVNDAPVAADDSAAVIDGAVVSGALLTNDTDVDVRDQLRVASVEGISAATGAVVEGQWGTLTVAPDGTYSYMAGDALGMGQQGEETFSYVVSDGAGGLDEAVLEITVTGANDAPTARLDRYQLNEGDIVGTGGVPATGVLANDVDPDRGETLSVVSLAGLPLVGVSVVEGLWGVLTLQANGDFSYAADDAGLIAHGEVAVDSFAYEIADAYGLRSQSRIVFEVAGQNQAPVAVDDAVTAQEGGAVSGTVLGNDTDLDASDILQISRVAGQATQVGVPVVGTWGVLILQANGTYSYVASPAAEALMEGQTVQDAFVYEVADGHGGFDEARLVVNLRGANDAPTAIIDRISVNEGDVVARGAMMGALANDVEVDALDTLHVTSVNGSALAVGASVAGDWGELTLREDGGFAYAAYDAEQLAEGQSMDDVFTYQATDGSGVSSTARILFSVAGVNDLPVAEDDLAGVFEGEAVAGNALDNDHDPDLLDQLRVSAVNGDAAAVGAPVNGDWGVLTLGGDGVYSYVAGPATDVLSVGEVATDRFVYQVSDGHGGLDLATLSVTVQGRNDAPQAYEDLRTVAEGGVAASTGAGVLANDVDIDASDRLTVVSVGGAAASVGAARAGTWGALTLQADGSYAYVANAADALAAGETATDTFAYSVADLTGARSTSRVVFTVTGVNDAPVAINDAAAANEGGSTSGSVLANDSDVDANDVLRVFAVGGEAAAVGTAVAGAWGVLTLQADGSYVYVADRADALAERETAVDRFSYSVSDGHGGVASAALEITLTGRNDAPVAVDDVASTIEDGTPATGDLLANDFDVDQGTPPADAGTTPTLVSVDVTAVDPVAGVSIAGAHGSLQVAADGRFVYVADQDLAAGQTVTESFDYVIEDIYGAQDTATLTVTATGVNDAPVAVDDAAGTLQLGVVSGAVLGNDSDVDVGDVLRVAAVEGAAASVGVAIAGEHGALTLHSSGAYTYRAGAATAGLAKGETAVDVFTYLVADDHGGTDVADLTIIVTGTNDAPRARDDAGAVIEDGAAATGDLLLNDDDPDGSDRLLVASIRNADGQVQGTDAALAGRYGTLTVSADGSYVYEADRADDLIEGETSQDIFTYEITDGNGGSSVAQLTFAVAGQDEYMIGTPLADVLVAGLGDDILLGRGGDDKLSGLAGDDRLVGGAGDDELIGGRGDDLLVGRGGADILRGGAGADVLNAGTGADLVIGGNGADILRGGTGDDVMNGGAGGDRLLGRGGDDALDGGRGDDLLWGDKGFDVLVGRAGDDKLYGGGDGDILQGGVDNDRLEGGEGADDLQGGSGMDRLLGQGGDDLLDGGQGTDVLKGGLGDDQMDGGRGQDRLVGGWGADLFLFEEGDGQDVIVDFNLRADRIFLSGSGVAGFESIDLLQIGTDTHVFYGAGEDSIVLLGVAAAGLDATDFVF